MAAFAAAAGLGGLLLVVVGLRPVPAKAVAGVQTKALWGAYRDKLLASLGFPPKSSIDRTLGGRQVPAITLRYVEAAPVYLAPVVFGAPLPPVDPAVCTIFVDTTVASFAGKSVTLDDGTIVIIDPTLAADAAIPNAPKSVAEGIKKV